MPNILVPQLNKKISCKTNDNLMTILQKNEVPVASSCLGDGICGKCVLSIQSEKTILRPTVLEAALIKKYNWDESQRASCQLKVTQDIVVHSTYW